MKKGRFLWSAHRITERQKDGKARSIKGKQLKNSRNTASKQPVVLLSSRSVNLLISTAIHKGGSFLSGGLLLSSPSGCLCLRRRASGDILRHEVPSGASPVAHLSSARDNLLLQTAIHMGGSFLLRILLTM